MEKIKILKPRDFNFGEEEVFIKVKDIRRGDIFYECERFINHKLIALTSARRVSDGFYIIAEDIEGEKVEIFYSEYTNYPSPSLYKEPQYLTEIEKEMVYVVE